MDGQTTCNRKTALCTIVYRAVKKIDNSQTFIGSSQFDVEYHGSYNSNNGNDCEHDDCRQERIVYKHQHKRVGFQ